MWNTHNAVFGSKRSAIYAQAIYFMHSTMPSLRLSDISIICCVTYLQFPIQTCFSSTSVNKAAQPIDVLCANFVKFCRWEMGEIVRGLPDKNVCLALLLSILSGSRPKSPGSSPRQCTQGAPDFIKNDLLSAEL